MACAVNMLPFFVSSFSFQNLTSDINNGNNQNCRIMSKWKNEVKKKKKPKYKEQTPQMTHNLQTQKDKQSKTDSSWNTVS